MTKITNSNPNAVSNFEGEGKALGKLSNPKFWTATAITAGLAAVVTATVAFTVPAAAVACSFAAIALISVAALLGMTALALHYICLTKQKSQAGDQPNPDLESSQPQENIPNESARQLQENDLAPDLVGEVTDQDQIAILKKFNPDAQRVIVGEKLFDEKTENLQWRKGVLNFFQPEEIQLLLNHFGQKFEVLDFSGYDYHLEAIDLSCCKKLLTLSLDGQSRLQRISGLAQCPYLRTIFLTDCTGLDKDSVMAELFMLKRPDLFISFSGSSLCIDGQAAMLEDFAPNGKWEKFLASHPNAWLDDLLQDDPNQEAILNEALRSLENCKAMSVKNSGQRSGHCYYGIGLESIRQHHFGN